MYTYVHVLSTCTCNTMPVLIITMTTKKSDVTCNVYMYN